MDRTGMVQDIHNTLKIIFWPHKLDFFHLLKHIALLHGNDFYYLLRCWFYIAFTLFLN